MRKTYSHLSRLIAAVTILIMLSGFASLEALFAPKAELWERWSTHDPKSTKTTDHSIWDKFLKAYVVTDKSGLNRVPYGKVPDAEKKQLRNYLAALAKVPVSKLNRTEQMAYWINLYNALTVRVILDHHPVKSIRDIDLGPGLFTSGPWNKKLIKVEGEEVSLNDIEHRILRPIWKDPRIHYAVNCASIGCPNLQDSAFNGEKIDTELEKAAAEFINHPRGVRISDNALIVSKIYAWFTADFGGSEQAVLKHLRKYAKGDLAKKLQGKSTISDTTYDWRLNE